MTRPTDPSDYSPVALADALADMQSVLDQEHQLGDYGFGIFEPRKKTRDEREQELRHQRELMIEPRSLAQFLASRQWLSRFPKIKALSRNGSSYGLKHVAEHEIGYVTNGVFIAAAVAEGFTVRRIASGPNAQFNISARAWQWPAS